jgi:hypothetical protein
VKQHTVFLREGCILPDRFILHRQPFCEGWAEAIGTVVTELDAGIRDAGWHFMWIESSHSSRALGRTPESAIRGALVHALGAMNGRFNAAELGSLKITSCLGFKMAKVTLLARHIQEQTSLDRAEERRLQQLPAH